MTNLEIILLVMLWIISGIFLLYKLFQHDNTSFDYEYNYAPEATLFASIIIIIINPIIWFGAILYFTFIKPWKQD